MLINKLIEKRENGQVIPIIALMMIAIVGMVALIIDGGGLMSNRRTAQAAADAGALAGAKILCSGGSNATDVAESYALSNKATSAMATIADMKVNVDVTVSNPSFFAGIFGKENLTANATASAGCFGPKGNYLLPIAWSCRPPVGGTTVFDPELGCKMMALDYELWSPLLNNVAGASVDYNTSTFIRTGNNIINQTTKEPAPQIYIVMDKISTKFDTRCKSDYPTDPNAINCDINGDGKNDIEGQGNRGWLDLNNGGGGTSDLVGWIKNGLDFQIYDHTWLDGQDSNAIPVYNAVKDYREGKIVYIPVFNQYCNDSDPISNPGCMAEAHTYPKPTLPPGGDYDPNKGNKPQFHVITFDAFYVSCVRTQSPKHGEQECPGFKLAQEINPGKIPDNTPSIEGYFLKGYKMDLEKTDNCLVNLGNCTVSLIK